MSTSVRPVAIFGTGSYLPERVFRNEEFSKFIDTSDEWITQRTGMKERRFAADGQFTSDLAAEAGRRALADAGWKGEDLDFVLLGTCTPDSLLPNTADWVHQALGCRETCGAIDIINACSSFTYGLAMVRAMVACGHINKGLVIGAEKLSQFLDFEDRGSCILFGDGAGAACIGVSEDGRGDILACRLGASFDFDSLNIAGGGSRVPASHESVDTKRHKVSMNGRAIYKFAVSTLRDETRRVCEDAGVNLADVKCIVPHQVNIRIIQSAMETLEFPMERVFINLDKYGNTSAASVPIALDEAARAGYFSRGDLVVLCAFGGGKAWGSQVIRW
ncbi:MAG: 3-oxoacyl-ACP synthase III family protein [Planctomycetota bacterium]